MQKLANIKNITLKISANGLYT